MRAKKIIITAVTLSLIACSCGGNKSSYEALTQEAGASLAAGNYRSALEIFLEALDKNSDRAEAYIGIGWCAFKLDSLALAVSSFSDGSARTGADADLFAGWAFALNARKDYAESNMRSQTALDLDGDWVFTYGMDLSSSDLHVLRAENYFLLGQYTQSKAEIVILNPAFTSVDVTTDSGQAQLAQEIELRKSLAKRI